MPPKKTTPISDRLELAKALNNIGTKIDTLDKAVETLKVYDEEKIKDLEMTIMTKKMEHEDLMSEFDVKYKNARIKCDQDISEYGRVAAIGILEKTGEMAINAEEYENMKNSINVMRRDHESELQRELARVKQSADETLQRELTTKELEHKATVAELTAVNTQQLKEISRLETQISALKEDLVAQRDLTRDVAEAGRSAPITQNMGKH